MTDEPKKGLLARVAAAPLATAGTLGVLSQASKVAEVALNAPGVGALAASVIVAIGFGLSSINWINDDRAKRVARALLNDPEITFEQYRAVWTPKVNREEVSRQLREQLEAIDRATENEVADALLNALRYRTKNPKDKRFGFSILNFLRDATAEDLATTRRVFAGALEKSQDPSLQLNNNRSMSDQLEEPGVMVIVGRESSGRLVCPASAVAVRRIFRKLKAADFARSTGVTVGNFVYDGKTPPGTETDEDSLIIDRVVAQRLVDVIPA